MTQFEGKKSLNREASELEVNGKFKLTEEELDSVSGGCGPDIDSNNAVCPECADHPKLKLRLCAGADHASEIFKCPNCNACYRHIFEGDSWEYCSEE